MLRLRWLGVGIFLGLTFLLTFWVAGWWAGMRLDPLFALAPQSVSMMPLIWLVRADPVRVRRITYAIAVLLAAAIALAAGAVLGTRVAWGQALVVVLCGLLWSFSLDWLVARPISRSIKILLLLIATILVVPAAVFALRLAYLPPDSVTKPKLVMMTSLPLVWGTGGEDIAAVIQGKSKPAPAVTLLERDFAIEQADFFDSRRIAPGALLLLAHPRALSPRELVAIDAWLRTGGKAVILADAFVARDAPFALGDPRNPPITSLLTPLLDHWGLELALPANQSGQAISMLFDGDQKLLLPAPGQFVERRDADGVSCQTLLGGVRVDCRIGKGKAVLLADADFLYSAIWHVPPLIAPHSALALSPISWRADAMTWLKCRLMELASPVAACPKPLAAVWIR